MSAPVCPATFQGCCDDICRNCGCLKMDGEPMLVRCSGGCGAWIAVDGSYNDDCECDPEFYEDEQEDQWIL